MRTRRHAVSMNCSTLAPESCGSKASKTERPKTKASGTDISGRLPKATAGSHACIIIQSRHSRPPCHTVSINCSTAAPTSHEGFRRWKHKAKIEAKTRSQNTRPKHEAKTRGQTRAKTRGQNTKLCISRPPCLTVKLKCSAHESA